MTVCSRDAAYEPPRRAHPRFAGQLYMRGVGNTANKNYLDPAIIPTVDGVPIARGSATSVGDFYDLKHVEVLKGPDARKVRP